MWKCDGRKESVGKVGIGYVIHGLTFSLYYRLEAGYVCEPDGSVHALKQCDLKLYQHGEHGTPPKDYAFTFETGSYIS